MTLIDRYILGRFFTNFAILFALLFLFAIAIDLVVALDRFVEATGEAVGEAAGTWARATTFVGLALNFQTPRLFQFYAYLHGLVAIGAMGFTLAQMHRYRELVAMLSAGLSMQRIAVPFVVAMFVASVVQLVNQELLLPRVAPLLIRDHSDIGRHGVAEFPVALTPDGGGNLFQAPSFAPSTNELRGLTILERDERGRTIRRITAERGVWTTRSDPDPGDDGWALTGGRAITLAGGDAADAPPASVTALIDFYATDLSPRVLVSKRFGQFASMLSLRQIDQMLDTPGSADREGLLRYRFSRFSSVLVNVLLMWLALPAFLLRQPANLLPRTVLCAAIAIPAMLGSALFMMVKLPGIPPAVGVFLPVVILIPVVLGQWTYIRT